ncbi:hypothetical protein NON00_24465 [Roseomonas sp. GC11]|uniref:hypothetical protein n=1 Tax=Roseomonas sp. GC11 TaxID=2950546 RepID=UPI00210E0952|nr:hypothetical protein [Roseomonas sp. GC11]MCQ4163054.1 hypothetical protein [Roseomonas sp. GC11]
MADPDDVIAGLRGNLAATATTLLQELEELSRVIATARAEVIALRAEGLDERAIPTATDELAAIVQHTAQATHEILDACEKLELLAPKAAPEVAEGLTAATTRIYEACAFQDITGQRIAKVVSALQTIETRIGRAKASLAAEVQPPPAANAPRVDGLLNGPQLPGAAISQSAIDALFD